MNYRLQQKIIHAIKISQGAIRFSHSFLRYETVGNGKITIYIRKKICAHLEDSASFYYSQFVRLNYRNNRINVYIYFQCKEAAGKLGDRIRVYKQVKCEFIKGYVKLGNLYYCGIISSVSFFSTELLAARVMSKKYRIIPCVIITIVQY